MTPEAKARLLIDQKLEQAGWIIQDKNQINLGAGLGIAVREYPTDSGPADYVLFIDRKPVGVIEGFGVLAMCSVGPIISVMAFGLWIDWKMRQIQGAKTL